MNRKIEFLSKKMLAKTRGWKRWQKFVSVLGCVVVFCTTYALILPAITMEKDPYCGFEVHVHDESCYVKELTCTESTDAPHAHTESCISTERVLACTLPEEEAHTHNEGCVSLVDVLICTEGEKEAHQHTELCYSTRSDLTCQLEESEEHTHGEGCYMDASFLSCGMEQTEGHTHGESCYTSEEQQTCGKEETEGHTHEETCYTDKTVYQCGKKEGEVHTHTDDCYTDKLSCTLEAHSHSLACYSDKTAGAETAAQWEATLPELTANKAENMAAIARSQLGYRSVTANYIVLDEESETLAFYNRYAAWYPKTDAYQDWNTLFAAFCMHYAGVENDEELFDCSADYWGMNLAMAEKLSDPFAETIGIGDVLFYENDEGETFAAVVTEVTDTTITAIAGDILRNDVRTVAEVKLPAESDYLRGFLDVPSNDASAEMEMPEDDPRNYLPVVGYILEDGENTEISASPAPAKAKMALKGAMLLSDSAPAAGKLDIAQVENATMYFKPADQDPTLSTGWTNVTAATEPLKGNEHIKLQVDFYHLSPKTLAEHNYKMHFSLPIGLDRCDTTGSITVGSRVVGTLTSDDDQKHVTITFDQAWVDSLNPDNDQQGNFFITAQFDQSALDGKDDPSISIGPITIKPGVDTTDMLARYGEVNLTKRVAPSLTSAWVGGKLRYYLTYTLTVQAGEHGAQDVEVRDIFNDTTNIAAIRGVNSTDASGTVVTANGDGIARPKDLRISGSAAAGSTSPGTVSMQNIVPEGETAEKEYMVWNIGNMGSNEVRELTYTVELSEKYTSTYHGTDETLDNSAQLFSKGHPRNTDNAHFTSKTNMEIHKEVVSGPGKPIKNSDGTYTIEYKLTVSAHSDNSFTIKNVTVDDSFVDTAYNVDEWVRYDEDSFKVDNTAVAASSITFTNNGRGEQRGDSRASFTELPIGDMAPGQTKVITYTANLAQNAFTVANGAVHVGNTAKVYDASEPQRKLAHQSNAGTDITGVQWTRKFVGETLTAGRIENLGGENFTLARGDLKYEVIVNESGDWDMNRTTIVDTAVDAMLNIIGNVRIDAYLVDENNKPADGANDAATLAALTSGQTPVTKWIMGTNGATSFRQNLGDLNFPTPPEGKNYAYVLTYYATIDRSKIGSSTSAMIAVGNRLSLSGTVGNGSGTFIPINTSVTASATIANPSKFDVKKSAWYYEKPGEGVSGYVNGAFYWVVRVDGSQLKAGLKIQDSSNYFKNGSYKNYNHDGKDGSNPAFVGAYAGSLGADENGHLYELQDLYPNVFTLLSNVPSPEVSDGLLHMIDYEVVGDEGQGRSAPIEIWYGGNITNDDKQPPVHTGGGVEIDGVVYYNHDVNVKFRTDYDITPGESLYVVFRTEPMVVPTKGSDTFSYANKINYNNGSGWKQLEGDQAPTQTLYGSDGIQKTVTYPRLYFVLNGNGLRQPGSWNSKIQGSQGPYAYDSTLIWNYLKNTAPSDRGFFTGWNIRLNQEGKLNGTYRVKEIIPEGMELAYLRLAGRGAGSEPFTFNEIDGLGSEWERVSYTPSKATGDSGNGNNGSIVVSSEKTPVIYYRNGNEILFEITSFKANEANNVWADIQVMTHVTDEKATTGQETDFVNTVELLDLNNRTINKTSADVTLALSDMIDKSIAASKDGDAFNSSVLPFRIQINDYLVNTDDQAIPDLNPDGKTINLIDEMSTALIIDPDSVRIYYGKFASDPWIDKTKDDPQLNVRVPKYNEKSTEDYKGYTVVIADNGHTMKVNNLPDDKIMTMFYDTTVDVAPGVSATISNDAHWEGVSTPGSGSNVTESFKFSSSGAVYPDPTISIRKVDPSDAQGKILNGATFEMEPVLYFDTQNNRFIAPAESSMFQGVNAGNLDTFHGTTHDNRLLVFGDNKDDQGNATTHKMVYHTVYKLVEKSAPDGYVCDSTPYYFIIARSTGVDDSSQDIYPNYLEYLGSTALANEKVYVSYSGGEYNYTAYNHKGQVEVAKKFGGNVESGRPVEGTYYFNLFSFANNGMPMGDPLTAPAVITYTAADIAAYDAAIASGSAYTYKTAVFSDLALNVPYYLFETDASGNAVGEGGTLEINGQKFVVNYEFPEGSTNHQVIPKTDNKGFVQVKTTNNRYQATVTKSFADVVGSTLPQGLVGTYDFGIWQADKDGIFFLTKAPLDTQSITFRIQDSNVSEKSASFTGLAPGTYAIYELDANGNPLLEGTHFSHNSTGTIANEFIVHYTGDNTFTIASGETEAKDVHTVNTSSVSLPMTGGTGTLPYQLLGTLFVSVSLLAGFGLRRRKGKEELA